MLVVVRKKMLIAVCVLIVSVALAVTGTVLLVGRGANVFAKTRRLPIYCVERGDNKVAISFDAAWGADKTVQILDTLDKYGVKATFFLVGFWVDNYPDMLREIDRRGHLVGNHSTNHPHANQLSKEEIRREIETTNGKIEAVIGKRPTYFRAPFGEYNDRLLEVIDELGMQCIQWDVDSLDWKGIGAQAMAERVVPKAKSGSIILFHNASEHITTALPLVLLGLKNKGLLPVTMNEVVFKENYFIATDGAQKLRQA